MQNAFYDSTLSYEEKFQKGPFIQQSAIPKRKSTVSSYRFLGHDINIPFGIPAAPLLNSNYVKLAFKLGFDVITYKTQRSTRYPLNPFPNVMFVDLNENLTLERAKKPIHGRLTPFTKGGYSLVNSFGMPSEGPDFWQEDVRKAIAYEGKGQMLILSVVGTIKKGFSENDYYNDFAHVAYLASQTGVKAIEINLSCPNVATEGVLCYTPQAVITICHKARKKVAHTPLLIKLGYFLKKQQDLLEKIVKHTLPYVQGYTVINTIPAPIVDSKGKQAFPGAKRLVAGVSGTAIKWAGIDMVKRLVKLKEKFGKDFAIIGVGGVISPKDYVDYRKAGADVVQSAAGSMWNPNLAYQVWQAENSQ